MILSREYIVLWFNTFEFKHEYVISVLERLKVIQLIPRDPRKTTRIHKNIFLIPLKTLHWQTLRTEKKHVYHSHQSKLLCLFLATLHVAKIKQAKTNYSHLSQLGENITTPKYPKIRYSKVKCCTMHYTVNWLTQQVRLILHLSFVPFPWFPVGADDSS